MKRSRAGFTLIEVVIATAILAAVMGLLLLMMVRSSGDISSETDNMKMEEQGRKVLEDIAAELRMADAGSIETARETSVGSGLFYAIKFNTLAQEIGGGSFNFSSEKPNFSRAVCFALAPEDPDPGLLPSGGSAEVRDGVDNDKDNLIDESIIERYQWTPPSTLAASGGPLTDAQKQNLPNAGSKVRPGLVASNVRNLSFQVSGTTPKTVTIRLTLQRWEPKKGLVLREAVSTVAVRN
jgi:prepilin-type N-terminal cleavage/methylation domain-containing protein